MMTTENEQREDFFKNLLNALRPCSGGKAHEAFAACETISPSQGFNLASFNVEGAGEFQLPLAANDIPRLLGASEKASFRGLDPQSDVNMRHCWQVDASKVSFPWMRTFISNTVQPLAMKAVGALGLDGVGMQLDTQLDKLLFYEASGHFTFHRFTGKEKEVFAMLILQLPTEEGYEGGVFVMKHSYGSKELDCHMVSRIGFCSMIFTADCLLKLQKIRSGSKLCLAFKLVNHDFFLQHARKEFLSSQVSKVDVALEPWLQEATEGKLDVYGGKLAIPLNHLYAENEISFARLEENDRILADVLNYCTDKNKEKALDLYFCVACKYQGGTALPCNYCDHACTDPDHYSMKRVTAENIVFSKMIGLHGEDVPDAFRDIRIDMQRELVSDGEDPFDPGPVESTVDGSRLEYRYDRALLIAWPKALSISIACEGGVPGALGILEKMPEQRAPIFTEQVHQVLRYCEKNHLKVWGYGAGYPCYDLVTPRLLRLCTGAHMLEVVVRLFKLLAKETRLPSFLCSDSRDQCHKIGVRNVTVARAIAAAVQEHGWESVSSAVIDLTKECAFTQGKIFAQLVEQLMCTGSIEAGALVAKTTSQAFEARIAELESQEVPEFTWCQPLARLPWFNDIETFLRGPEERLVQRPFESLRLARNFADNYFNISQWAVYSGYSAIAAPGEDCNKAFCDIQKTGHLFKAKMDQCIRKQKEVNSLRLKLGKFMSVVFESKLDHMTRFPHGSNQPGRKRRRLETEDTEDEEIR